jgi:UDP-2,3-diacylglucosamine pyrophosphatase LpxH
MARLPESRSVFVSDAHLGSRGVRAGALLEFLDTLSCERLYLLGDIVDFWQMRRRWHWEPLHGEVLSAILRLARSGVRVTYVPGNHDWFFRAHPELSIGGVEVARHAVHETAEGRRMLVVHGDEFDRSGKAATLVADVATGLLHAATRVTDRLRRASGRRTYFPLGSRVRERLRRFVPHVARFEEAAASAARSAGLDGVVCGHLHVAAIRAIEGVLYCNTGDWVDSCTAIREERSGALALVEWGSDAAPARARARTVDAAFSRALAVP